MQRSMVFILGSGVGVALGLAVGQLSAADLDLADQEIARLVVQLEQLERENASMEAQLERWVGGAPALPADLQIAAPVPEELDEDGITENEAPETGPDAEATPPAEDAAEADAAPAGGEPDVADLLGALLEAEGESLTPPAAKPGTKPAAVATQADTKPTPPAATKPATKPAAKPGGGWGSGEAPPGWPSSSPRNLQPAAVNAAVRAAVSGVGELAAVDCRSFPCVVAVQASDPADPCCASLQQRLRAIDGYLMYAGPSQPLTVGGRATVITTWYPAGSEVDLEALSRRMDALRRGL
ncbi:MAG: hypothetical protein H6741_31735 [Alphaproteobacteria bacterium]|nr:hypothetical protein [Alphaproteobacteria bacterium]